MDELPPGKWRDGSEKAKPNHKWRDRKPHPSTQALQGPRDRAPEHSTTPKLTRTERRRLKKKTKRKEKRMELRKAATDLAAPTVGGRRRTRHKAASMATFRECGQQERATKAMRQPPKWKRRLLAFLYDSGADGHYPTEKMQKRAGLSIIGNSTKRVAVADGNISEGRHTESNSLFRGFHPEPTQATHLKTLMTLC